MGGNFSLESSGTNSVGEKKKVGKEKERKRKKIKERRRKVE